MKPHAPAPGEWLLAAASVLALTAYCIADALPGLLVAGIPAILLAYRFGRRRRVPRALSVAATLGVLGYAALAASTEGFSVSVFCRFVALLIVVRLLDRAAPRDDAQLLALCVFLLIGAVLTSASFLLCLVLLVSVPVLIAAVVGHQLRSAERAVATGQAGEPPRVRPAAPASPSVRRDFRRLVAGASLAAVGVSAVIFIVMPRGLGDRSFGRWGGFTLGPTTGFTDTVRLGYGGVISESQAIVADLRILDADGTPIENPEPAYYLRGAVLEEYDNGNWREAGGATQSFRVRGGLAQDIVPDPRPTLRQEITLRSAPDAMRGDEGRHVFAVWTPLRYRFEENARLAVDEDTLSIRRSGRGGRVRYTVWSGPPPEPSPAQLALPRDLDAAPSFPSPAIRELAAEVLAGAELAADPALRPIADDARAVERLESFLRLGFDYTLENQAPPLRRDPIEWFLLEHRRGHCEYFASALAALCRSVGIPARVVSGFVATEYSPVAGHFTVRESNAHAWVEAEIAPGVWRTFDPTPPADFRTIHEPGRDLASRFRRWFAALEYGYIEAIVNFDASSRSSLLGSAEDRAAPMAFLGARGGSLRNAVRLVGLALLAAAVLGGSATILLRLSGRWAEWRRRLLALLPRRLGGGDLAAELAIYDGALAALARLGLPKPPWRPPQRHARELEGAGSPAAAPFAEVAGILYRTRFGGARPTREELAAMTAAVERLEALARETPRRARPRTGAAPA